MSSFFLYVNNSQKEAGVSIDMTMISVSMECTALCANKLANGSCKKIKSGGVVVLTLNEKGVCGFYRSATDEVGASGRAKY